MVHLSSDVLRKTMAGVRLTEHRGDAFGHGLYDAGTTRRTYAALRRHAARWLRRGRAAILDATFGSPDERAHVEGLARRLRVPLRVLVCHADDEVLQARLRARASQPGVVSDARLDLWPELRAAFTEPAESEGVLHVDATQTPEAMLEQALTLVREGERAPLRRNA
jgi:predicted kinase